MDSEEKELLRKLVSKVDNLEKELTRRDEIIQKMQEQQGSPELPKFPKVDIKNDRLAKILVQKAREKVIAQHKAGTTVKAKQEAEALKKQVSFGELARYAIKNRLLKEGKETDDSSGEGETKKVYLE